MATLTSSPASHPSPTGTMHIGTARTALFNWLLRPRARRKVPSQDRGHRPRAFHPRSDAGDPRRDDVARSRLGRRGRQPVRAQGSPRRCRACHAARRHGLQVLLHAGRHPVLPRRAAKAEGTLHALFSAPGATLPEDQHPDAPLRRAPEGPRREGETVIEDAVQGTVRFRNDQLDDMVLLRSGRDAHLHACRRRGRPRHGRDPCDPWRRPPQQRGAAGADIPRHGLGGTCLGRISR